MNDATSAPSDVNLMASTPSTLGMSEAGFSVNFKWVDEYGGEEQFTMRETTWEKGLEALPRFKAQIRKMGYTPRAEYEAKHTSPAPLPAPAIAPAGLAPLPGGPTLAPVAPVPAAAPASTAQTGGSEYCTAIKKVVDEGKTTYQFFKTAADEHPALRINSEQVAERVLTGFVDFKNMPTGQRFQINWDVDWQNSKKINAKNNMPYKDVMAVRPRQAQQIA